MAGISTAIKIPAAMIPPRLQPLEVEAKREIGGGNVEEF